MFLCHAPVDAAEVCELYRRLRADGRSVWYEPADLLGGQSRDHEIRAALRASRVALACLSTAAVGSVGSFHRDLRIAREVADEQPEGRIFLIPVRLDDVAPPARLGHLRAVDLFTESGYDLLLKAILHAMAE